MVWGLFFVPYFYKKENCQNYVYIIKKTNRTEEFSVFYFFPFSSPAAANYVFHFTSLSKYALTIDY